MLLDFAADDPEGQARLAALVQALGQLGWIADHNLRIEARCAAADVERVRKYAIELVGLTPDVIVAGGATSVRSLQQATDTVPIVFANWNSRAERVLAKTSVSAHIWLTR